MENNLIKLIDECIADTGICNVELTQGEAEALEELGYVVVMRTPTENAWDRKRMRVTKPSGR